MYIFKIRWKYIYIYIYIHIYTINNIKHNNIIKIIFIKSNFVFIKI